MMRLALIAALAAAALAPALARGQDSKLRDALRQTTAQLRQAEEEQARLAAEKAGLEKQVEGLRAELAAAKRAAPAAGGGVSRQKLAEAQEAAEKAAAALDACQKDAAAKAAEIEGERAEMAGRLDGVAAKAAACEEKNARMVRAGMEFIGWLGGAGNVCEPVFGFRRVALENKTQEFEDRLLDHKAAAEGAAR